MGNHQIQLQIVSNTHAVAHFFILNSFQVAFCHLNTAMTHNMRELIDVACYFKVSLIIIE